MILYHTNELKDYHNYFTLTASTHAPTSFILLMDYIIRVSTTMDSSVYIEVANLDHLR